MLLSFGNVECLLNKDEWKDELSTSQVKVIRNDRDKLELFCNNLIPFNKNMEFVNIR